VGWALEQRRTRVTQGHLKGGIEEGKEDGGWQAQADGPATQEKGNQETFTPKKEGSRAAMPLRGRSSESKKKKGRKQGYRRNGRYVRLSPAYCDVGSPLPSPGGGGGRKGESVAGVKKKATLARE